jgi:hypothetical protein
LAITKNQQFVMAKLSWMKYANNRMLDSRLRGIDGNFGFLPDAKHERDIIALSPFCENEIYANVVNRNLKYL